MTVPYSFKLPNITTKYTTVFGLPTRGTFGRGIYVPKSIVLHSLRVPLDTYDAQVLHPERTAIRTLAQSRHPSLHFAIGYDGECHQYVDTNDVAWGMWDYWQSEYPDPFPEGAFTWLTTYPDISPDYYCIHIGAMSGMFGLQQNEPITSIPMSESSKTIHARLIAYLCNQYNIICNTANVVRHELIDLQFVGDCIGDADYPYAEILARAQTIIANGGELDAIFDREPTLEEITGPFTLDVSRLSSAAYLV